MKASDYQSEADEIEREDIRREDREKRSRLNWRCRNQPCDGTCPDCQPINEDIPPE
jgi:hypothetical protein